MSLLNNMLSDLEDRQAFLSEGRDVVLDGLSPVNDENFHHTGRKLFNTPLLILIFSMCFLLSAGYLYKYYSGLSAVTQKTGGTETAETQSVKSKPATVDIESPAADQVDEENQIILKMDYGLSLNMDVQQVEEPGPAETDNMISAETLTADLTIPDPAPLEPSILAIEVNYFEGAGSVVKMVLNNMSDYRIYPLKKPARIVTEFDEFLSLPEDLPEKFDSGLVNIIRGHHVNSKRTMVVLDLSEPGIVDLSDIKDTHNGHELTIYISPENKDAGQSGSPPDGGTTAKQSEGTLTLSRNRSTPDQLLKRGINAYHKGKIREGLEQISKALEINPAHVEARSTLVNLLISRNNIPDAIQTLESGMEILPAQYDWVELKAKLLVKMNKRSDAIEALMSTGPDINTDPDYYAFLAALLQQQGRNEEAVVYYQNVLNVRGDNGVWWMGLGISLERTGYIEKAEDAYKNAARDNSLSPDLRSYVKKRLSVISRQ